MPQGSSHGSPSFVPPSIGYHLRGHHACSELRNFKLLPLRQSTKGRLRRTRALRLTAQQAGDFFTGFAPGDFGCSAQRT